jgi:hypothetical protein
MKRKIFSPPLPGGTRFRNKSKEKERKLEEG